MTGCKRRSTLRRGRCDSPYRASSRHGGRTRLVRGQVDTQTYLAWYRNSIGIRFYAMPGLCSAITSYGCCAIAVTFEAKDQLRPSWQQ